jgi:hypothetical protein
VFLWFVGTALVAVWFVFRDPAFDHRLLLVGVLLPDVVDALTGGVWLFHSITGSVLLLAVVMGVTVGRRALRRRLIALPIGTFLHLVFDGAFTDTDVFWWPFTGSDLPDMGLPSWERGWWNIPLEIAGAAMVVWAYRRFGLTDADRRHEFVRTGHIDRSLV